MKRVLLFCCLFLQLNSFAGVVSEINISGNRRTKNHIILRELTFKQGDTIHVDEIAEHIDKSQNNLLNTSLFNFATLEMKDSLEFTRVDIKVTERWYIWPEVIIKFQERNFTEWLVNKDLSRIDYGLYITHKNFRGRKEKLQLQYKNGFNQKIGLLYQIPYLTKSLKAGLTIGVSYNTQNEVFTGIDSLNKMIYTKNPEDVIMETYNVHLEYTRRNNLYLTHYFMADYKDVRLIKEMLDLKADFLSDQSELKFFQLAYIFKDDHRDSRNYPLNGYYGDFQIKQHGLGFSSSGLNVTQMTANYRNYFHVDKRWYFSFGAYAEYFSKPQVPFYLQNGLGFNRYVRSYEPYVIFGQFSSFAKVNLKYKLLSPTKFTVPLIPSEKFSKVHIALYSNIFLDAGYVHNTSEDRFLNNVAQYGAGAGLDFVTFYDLVWRFEYSINRYKEHGIYISFVAPI